MKFEKFAFAQFCDDIRFEIGNKTTLVGLYTGEMNFPALPAFVPKLCCATTIVWPSNEVPTKIEAKLMIGEEVGLSERLPDGALGQFVENARSAERSEPVERIAVNLNFAVTPVNLTGETTIRMLVYVDDIEIEAGTLKVKVGPVTMPS